MSRIAIALRAVIFAGAITPAATFYILGLRGKPMEHASSLEGSPSPRFFVSAYSKGVTDALRCKCGIQRDYQRTIAAKTRQNAAFAHKCGL
jgi:hypothetical protein